MRVFTFPSRISNLRRAALFVLIVLQLGVTTTIAIAWTLAGAANHLGDADPILTYKAATASSGNGWQVIEYVSVGRRSRVLEEVNAENTWDAAFDPPSWSLAHQPYETVNKSILEDERGWPFRSLRCRWVLDQQFTPTSEVLFGGVETRSFKPFWAENEPGIYSTETRIHAIDDHRALPLIPIWPRFIASVLFHGVAWIVVIALLDAIFGIRQRLRKRRNCCAQCGYSRRHANSSVCTECGHDARSRPLLFSRRRIHIAVACAVIMFIGAVALLAFLIGRCVSPHPLHIAAANNDVATIERLLAEGTNVDVRSSPFVRFSMASIETTPLMWACGRGNMDAARALIAGGADPRQATRHQLTALTFAAIENRRDMVQFLLNLPEDQAPNVLLGSITIIFAALHSLPETFQLLLDACADRPAIDTAEIFHRALGHASRLGRLKIMQQLIDAGAPLDLPDADSPLLKAIHAQQIEAVELLLDHDASVTRPDEALVVTAAGLRLNAVVDRLLEAGADPNVPQQHRHGRHALQIAFRHSDSALVQRLLEAGADPAATYGGGFNLLYELQWDEAEDEFIDFVLELGLDINHQSGNGYTVLMGAAHRRDLRAVRRLLAAGSDVTIRDHYGRTALDYASESLHLFLGDSSSQSSGGPVNPDIVRLIRERLAQTEQPSTQP